MHLRRTLALTLSAVLLIALTGCVKQFATDRPYTPAAGTNSQDASVDVLNAVIVASDDGSGTFIATFSNNEPEATTFKALEGIDQAQVEADGFSPMDIPAEGALNLATDGGVELSGDFALGNFVPLSVQFGTGEQVEMQVPVVPNCGDFEGLDGPADEEACAAPEADEH